MKGKVGQEFAGLPIMWGVDTYAINPEFVDHQLTSWGDMFDRQWKGKTALIDIPSIAIPMYGMYLSKTGQMAEPEFVYNLKKTEVDTVVNFLSSHATEGQFRAFWADFGTSLNLLISREVWVIDCWNSAVFAARSSDVPAYYLLPDEGAIGWFGTEHILAGAPDDKLPLIYSYLNHRLGADFALPMARQAYQTALYTASEIENAAGPEFYNWNFQGERTYKPISEIVPDKDEWIAQALFDPSKYEFSMAAGNSHPQGNLKDRGSIENIIANMGNIETWVDEIGYHIEAWSGVKTAAAL